MIPILVYYIAAPFLLALGVLTLLAKYGKREPPADILRSFKDHPIEEKWFRAVKRDGAGLEFLGDFEKQPDAVDRIYLGREEARAAGLKASFLVFNFSGEALEQIDS
jgi:hypothetical protein